MKTALGLLTSLAALSLMSIAAAGLEQVRRPDRRWNIGCANPMDPLSRSR